MNTILELFHLIIVFTLILVLILILSLSLILILISLVGYSSCYPVLALLAGVMSRCSLCSMALRAPTHP